MHSLSASSPSGSHRMPMRSRAPRPSTAIPPFVSSSAFPPSPCLPVLRLMRSSLPRQMYIVLAVLLGGGGFLYYQVKPIAYVFLVSLSSSGHPSFRRCSSCKAFTLCSALAHKVSASIDQTKETASQASGTASALVRHLISSPFCLPSFLPV
jgi:hypothetical protein